MRLCTAPGRVSSLLAILAAVLWSCAAADRASDEPAPSVVAVDLTPSTTVGPAAPTPTGPEPRTVAAPDPSSTVPPEEEEPPRASSVPVPAATAPVAPSREQARKLFNEGVVRFEQGDVRGARMSFEAAFRSEPNPAVLFNIGQCFLAEGNTTAACATFQRFLDESPPEVAKQRKPALLGKCPRLR